MRNTVSSIFMTSPLPYMLYIHYNGHMNICETLHVGVQGVCKARGAVVWESANLEPGATPGPLHPTLSSIATSKPQTNDGSGCFKILFAFALNTTSSFSYRTS